MADTKYCKHCGQVIDADCVVCPKCGKQVEDLKSDQKSVIINNSASSSASSSAESARVYVTGKPKNKWVAFFLCLFTLCGHKFYEGKFGMGILYLCTLGLFGIGWIIDLFAILGKPNPYYV
nr:MAG TPA: TM2 domain [Caudoviricetes sp.]